MAISCTVSVFPGSLSASVCFLSLSLYLVSGVSVTQNYSWIPEVKEAGMADVAVGSSNFLCFFSVCTLFIKHTQRQYSCVDDFVPLPSGEDVSLCL